MARHRAGTRTGLTPTPDDTTEPAGTMLLFVAWLMHVPGLVALGRADLAPPARHNIPALLLTALASIGIWLWTRSWQATLMTWGIGHVAWGCYMVIWIRAQTEQEETMS